MKNVYIHAKHLGKVSPKDILSITQKKGKISIIAIDKYKYKVKKRSYNDVQKLMSNNSFIITLNDDENEKYIWFNTTPLLSIYTDGLLLKERAREDQFNREIYKVNEVFEKLKDLVSKLEPISNNISLKIVIDHKDDDEYFYKKKN